MTWSDDVLKRSKTMLSRWRGADAALWTLTLSLKSITLLLTDPEREGNLMLSCSPVRVRGPVRWSDSDLAIAPTRLPDGSEGFAITDARAGVAILCELLETTENRALTRSTRPPLRPSADRHAIEKVAVRLERWQGVWTTMREIPAGETCLRLLLQRNGLSAPNQNLFVTCFDTTQIRGPVYMDASRLTVERARLANGDEGVALRDRAADLEILCRSIEAHENVPLY
jgi:hypothetical protein